MGCLGFVGFQPMQPEAGLMEVLYPSVLLEFTWNHGRAHGSEQRALCLQPVIVALGKKWIPLTWTVEIFKWSLQLIPSFQPIRAAQEEGRSKASAAGGFVFAGMRRGGEEGKGLLWKLPLVHSTEWGKLGPAFGYGVGCGVGVGAGMVGGAGLGFGFPGFQFGVGVGAGCGIGVGFGYGLGKGRAYDENGRYSNIGRLPARRNGGPSGAEIGAIVDDFVSGLRRTFATWEKEIEKRRR